MADDKTSVSDNGLRYKAKGAGSPFGTPSGFARSNYAVMSCFKCGSHRKLEDLQTKRLIGKNQKVCAPSCKTG